MPDRNTTIRKQIENFIFIIRSHKVMLDEDLARLYQVETKVLVQAVKRNLNRFPEDFMFQLSTEEHELLRSQFVTSTGRTGRRYAPYVFTEQGVAMLSSVLHSERAVQVNIEVMRAFVKLRRLISSHEELAAKLIELESHYDQQFRIVFEAIREIMSPKNPPKIQRIGFGRTS